MLNDDHLSAVKHREIAYNHGQTQMRGKLFFPVKAEAQPSVLLIHDAFGLTGDTLETARHLVDQGYTVFAADVWGNQETPAGEARASELIESMVQDREEWLGRISAAHQAALAQPEIDRQRIVFLGYCFGGSSVLEYLKTGAEAVGGVAVHPGLDILGEPWKRGTEAKLLVLFGADDPMALPQQWRPLKDSLTEQGVDWELNLYSGTVHAFTSTKVKNSPAPHVVAYHPQNARRAWSRLTHFLDEVLPSTTDNSVTDTLR